MCGQLNAILVRQGAKIRRAKGIEKAFLIVQSDFDDCVVLQPLQRHAVQADMMETDLRGFAVCTEPRSGSNFFCQLLTSTGVLGRPLEYFNGPGRRAFDDPDYPDDPEAQLRIILDRGSTPNGVYGFKIFSRQSDQAAPKRWAQRLPSLRFIHLQRRDVLGQAISRVRAEQTGRFRSYAQGNGAREHYDPDAIMAMLSDVVVGNARWTAYFAAAGKLPLTLFYEDIISKPYAAVSLTARLFSLGAVANLDAIDVRVQRDEVSEVWRHRFIERFGAMQNLPRLDDGRAPRVIVQRMTRLWKRAGGPRGPQ